MARIKLICLADGRPSPLDGQYVKEYDPDCPGHPGFVHLVTTPDPEEALNLPTAECFELWHRVSKRDPVRPDGKPNRPLTAYTAEIE